MYPKHSIIRQIDVSFVWGNSYVIILSRFILSLKDLMTFFLKVAENEKWQAAFCKMLVYEKMTIFSWTQYLKRMWFISSTKHEMFFHLLILPNMAAVISKFDKYVEIWIEHKRKTCIDGYYKKSFMETVMASTVKLGYVCLPWYMVKSYCTLPDNFLSQYRISRISYTIILYKGDLL